mmetsp:Transcript_59871/g.140991  ORF Transcript_59871/g.140991 Transcript_59871/m.140991 type:complete len:365 (+) Transcript_59871:165-1259(+)
MFLGLDSRRAVFLFAGYIMCYDTYCMLVHNAQIRGVQYDVITAVFVQECMRVLIGICMFAAQNEKGLLDLPSALSRSGRFPVMVIVPSILFALYNNLFITALSMLKPETVQVLLQGRIICTAALSVAFLKRELTAGQWFAIVLLVIGCGTSQLGRLETMESGLQLPLTAYMVLAAAVCCGSLSSVLLERALKEDEIDATTNTKQIIFSSLCACVNFLALAVGLNSRHGNPGGLAYAFSREALSGFFSYEVVPLLLAGSFVGVLSLYFLRELNAILKDIAKCIEIITLPCLSYIAFGYRLSVVELFGIAIVLTGVVLFNVFRPAHELMPHLPIDESHPASAEEAGLPADADGQGPKLKSGHWYGT